MRLSEKSQQIVNAFTKYVKTGDKSLIEDFTLEEIEIALLQFSLDKDSPPYIGMEKRIDELKEIKSEQKNRIDKWKDRAIGFILGLASGFLLYWLTK